MKEKKRFDEAKLKIINFPNDLVVATSGCDDYDPCRNVACTIYFSCDTD